MRFKKIDKGSRFGRLVVCGDPVKVGVYYKYECECDCGNYTFSVGAQLRNGTAKSCGCLRIESLVGRNRKHGMSKSRLHMVWCGMKSRCSNKNHISYKNYGAKGIRVSSEFSSFEKFYSWAMKSGYKEGLTLDRISNSGNYEPKNCRWVDWVIQNRNSKRNHLVHYAGKTMCVQEWSEKTGIKPETIRKRLKSGYSVGETVGK